MLFKLKEQLKTVTRNIFMNCGLFGFGAPTTFSMYCLF